MFILGCLRMLYLVPASWLDAFLVRKKPFEERYAHMKKWSKRIIKAFHCRVCIDAQGAIPQEGPLLFVSNHQSAFDMLLQMSIITTPFTFISKKENEKLPYVANWAKTLELIYFDREDRASAIHMLRESARQLKSGRNLLIFPEGTRCKHGQVKGYKSGIVFLAEGLDMPVVPVALNSDLVWSKGAFLRRPGKVVFEFMPPMNMADYAGKKEFMAALQEKIETACAKLG